MEGGGIMEVNGCMQLQVCNHLRVSKWWQHFHLYVNYPFKCQNQQFCYMQTNPCSIMEEQSYHRNSARPHKADGIRS